MVTLMLMAWSEYTTGIIIDEMQPILLGSHANGNRGALASSCIQLTFKTEWLFNSLCYCLLLLIWCMTACTSSQRLTLILVAFCVTQFSLNAGATTPTKISAMATVLSRYSHGTFPRVMNVN